MQQIFLEFRYFDYNPILLYSLTQTMQQWRNIIALEIGVSDLHILSPITVVAFNVTWMRRRQ